LKFSAHGQAVRVAERRVTRSGETFLLVCGFENFDCEFDRDDDQRLGAIRANYQNVSVD
jgi:hypothetical protein